MSDRDAQSRMPRLARYVITRGWMHVALITCVGIFLLPFVWMVATSLKTDEELLTPQWFPRMPRFVPDSPYVLPAPDVQKPLAVEAKAWERALPVLQREARAAAGSFLDQHPELLVDRAAQVQAASGALVNRISARINAKLWDGPEREMVEGIRAELTPPIIADAVEQRLARLELRGLAIDMLDAHRVLQHDAKKAIELWTVKSGPGKLVRARDGGVYLEYHFDRSDLQPVVLECPLRTTYPPEDWHKIAFSFKADNSWHRIAATIITPTQTWNSTLPVWLAQSKPTTSMFQFPSFEDSILKPRTWIPMRLQGQGARGEGQAGVGSAAPTSAEQVGAHATGSAKLRLTIHPSTTARAIWGKVQFNYARTFRSVPFWKYVGNSLVLVALTTAGTLFSSTFVAYAFARLRWPGRGVAFVLMLCTMMLPAQVTMVPSFVIWRQLGWYNTLNPLWVPAFLGSAFFIFLMTQHMKTIPRELEEAARIDGLNSIQTWWYVIVPLVKPAAAAIAIMTVMAAWNEFMGPLIYLRDQSRFPLSLGLFAIRLDAANDWTMIMAGNVLMTLPMILMFVVFQRYFIQGMTMGGVKG
jgi:multiple sugar transport system permease protein